VSAIGLYLPEWSTWNMRERDASLDSLWGTPLVYAVVFLMLNAVFIGGAEALNRVFTSLRPATTRTVAALMSFWLGAYLVLQATDRLYGWTAALLAAGIAWRMAKWAQPATRLRAIRRSTVWLFVLVAASAPAATGLALVRERSQIAGLPLARASAPNVLFIVLDTVRADHMSAYGYARNTTPVFDRLAADGVLFAQAMAPAPWTLPSHASMFTGRPVHEHGADRLRPYLDRRYPTLAEAMAGQGYVTAAFSANTSWVNRLSGLDRGFIHFDRRRSLSGLLARSVLGQHVIKRAVRHVGFRDVLGRRHGSEITHAFTSWLVANTRRPFFAFLNYYDAHAPYTAPREYRSRFMTARDWSIDEALRYPYPPGNWDGWEAGRSYWTAAYDAGLSSLDSEIGRLLQHLATSGELDNTLVMITSDHGEALGEHGLFQHGNSLYRHQIWVPLLIRLPRTVPAGMRVSDPVSTTDLPATVLALTQASTDFRMPGQTLSRFWSGSGHPAPGFEPVLSHAAHNEEAGKGWPVSRGRLWSLLTDEWHFIATEGGGVELFALAGDPAESASLASNPQVQPIVDRFLETLSRLLLDDVAAPDRP
jgi:arylsulfatase A-like enzyme